MRPGFQRRKITHAVNAVCKRLVSILTYVKKHSVPSSQYSVRHNPISVILNKRSAVKNPGEAAGGEKSPASRLIGSRSFASLRMTLEKIFSRSTYTGKKKIDKEIDKTVDELKGYTQKINELDQRIIRLQQSGKTTFRSMNKIHVYLTMRSKSYHKLHTLRYASSFNFSALLIFVLSLSFAISSNYSNWMGPILPKRLAAVDFIHASAPEDTSIYTGESNSLKIGYSNKEAKTVGINAISKSDRIPNADQYQLSMNLLSDGLNIPEENKLGYQQDSKSAGKQVSWYWEPAQSSNNSSRSVILSKAKNPIINGILQFLQDDTKKANAQEESADNQGVVPTTENNAVASDQPTTNNQLPTTTVVAREVQAPQGAGIHAANDSQPNFLDPGSQATVRDDNAGDAANNNSTIEQLSNSSTESIPESNPSAQTLSNSTVVAKEVSAPGPSDVIYDISDKITVRYHMEESKVKEFIILKDKTALKSNTLTFSIDSKGLAFKEGPEKDGSWVAVREEDKDKDPKDVQRVFRLLKPTIDDKNKKPGEISMVINGNIATYTINQDYLNSAEYPVMIDPPIVDGGTTCTWTNGGGDGLWATAGNWSCAGNRASGPPQANDTVVFDSTSYDPATGASDTVADNLYSVVMNGINWNGGGHYVKTGAIDPNNHFLYYATDELPGRVIKIDAQTNKPVSALTLNIGEDRIGSAVIDPSGTYGYFGTSTVPGRVIKVQLSDMTRVAARTLSAGESYLSSASISPNNDYVYFGTGTYTAKVVKIPLDDFVNGTKTTKNLDTSLANSMQISAANDYLYVVTTGGDSRGNIVRIDLGNFSGTPAVRTLASGENDPGASAISSDNGYLYVASGLKIIKLPLADFLNGSEVVRSLAANENIYSLAIDPADNYIYAGVIGTNPSRIVRLPLSDLSGGTETARILNSAEYLPKTLLVDGASGYVFTACYGTGVELYGEHSVAFDQTNFNRQSTFILGPTLALKKHAVSSGAESNNYKWDMDTLAVNSGELRIEGDTTVNPEGSVPPGCDTGSKKCGRGMEISAIEITVATNARIDADGLGFSASTGPSPVNSFGGGSHGGIGSSLASATTYGLPSNPVSLGSGGGNGDGGGAIKLSVSGTITIDGTVSAIGTMGQYTQGGGSGGSIYINANGAILNGSSTGKINANGGWSGYGGGGGGRVAIIAGTDNFQGAKSAYTCVGESTCNAGFPSTAGTIYTNVASQANGDLIIDNNNYNSGVTTKLPAASYVFDNITLLNKANLEVADGASLNISGATLTSASNTNTLTVAKTGTLTTATDFTLTNLTWAMNNTTVGGLQNLTIDTGGILTHSSNVGKTTSTLEDQLYKLNLSLNNLTINSGGSVNVDSKGYAAWNGPGHTRNFGASYGGLGGGNNGASIYGLATSPTNIGSGSGSDSSGNPGGGAAKITVTGQLTANGNISAKGGSSANNSGGSGGSIWLIADAVSGSGTISAAGGDGNGYMQSGGGGGRIKIEANTYNFPNLISADGGTFINSGYGTRGYAGTIILPSSVMGSSGNLTLGGAGNMTSLTLGNGTPYTFNSITVNNGGSLYIDGNPTAGLGCQGVAADVPCGTGGDITANNITVNNGGKISADGKGFYNMDGQNYYGPGVSTNLGGGGYGGVGGSGSGSNIGGQSYGDANAPLSLGSVPSWNSRGGSGGGAIKLTVTGTLNIVSGGSISANGIRTDNYAGSAGGSLYFIVGNLSGNGIVTANGSNGANGGGGGGGRIAIYARGNDTFQANQPGTGTVTANGGAGGAGYTAGTAGTFVYQHSPVVNDAFTPADGINGTPSYQPKRPTISFSAHDADTSVIAQGDYFRMKIELADDSGFASNLKTFEQTTAEGGSTLTSGGLTGSYAGMNYNSDGGSGNDSYQSTTNVAGSFAFSTELPQGHTYYIRLSACDPGGLCGQLSQWSTVTETHGTTVSPIDRLVFANNTTADNCTPLGAQTAVVNTMTPTYTVKMCNTLNETVTLASQQINFSTSPSTGAFYNTDGSGPITNKTITSTYYTQVKYKGNANGLDPGNYTLQAAGQGQGWTIGELPQKLINDVPHHLTLAIDGHNPNDQIITGENLTARVVARDVYGNPAKDSPNNFTGDNPITFTGATASSSGCSSNSNTNPTVRDKNSNNIPFGTATSLNFGNVDQAGGGQSSGVMILKMVEGTTQLPINLVVSGTYNGNVLNNQTAPASPYSLSVVPGDLNHIDVDPGSYPMFNTAQYAISEEDWATSGPKPYYPKVTVKDIYCNTKTDYDGPLWFSTEPEVPSTFGRNAAEPYTYVPATDRGVHTFNDYQNQDLFKISTGGDNLIVHVNGTNQAENTVTSDIHVRIKGRGIDYLGVTFDSPISGQDIDENLRSDVTVSAYDAKGNLQFDYAGLIYFTSTDPLADLPCTPGNQPEDQCLFDGVHGVLRFTADKFKFHTGGNHTITVHDDITLKSSSTDHLAPAISAVTVVKPHTVSGLTATAGYQSINLFWNNPADTLAKVHIYKKIGDGGSFALADEPTIIPGSATTSYQVKYLQNGTKYYFKIKGVIINTATGDEVESTAYSNSDGTVWAIPQDIGLREPQFLTQDSQGRIAANYKLRWNSNISVEYQLPGTTTWTAASSGAVSGDTLGLAGNENLVAHTTYFTPAVDIQDKYYLQGQGFRVRLRVDAEGSYVYEESSAVFCDTRLPHVNANESFIIMDVTGTNTATLTLNAREDGTPEQKIWYRLSNSQADIENQLWQVFYDPASPAMRPTQVVGWNLGADSDVYVQFKDPYNNIAKSGTAVLETPSSFSLKDGSNIDTEKYRLLLIWDDVTNVTNFSKYIVDRSIDAVSWEMQHDTSIKNGYLDVNLNSGQKYYYRVKTQDAFGNISRPTQILMSQPGAAPDVTAKPTITMQNWKQEYGVRATVTWDTDQSADSFVVYSKKPLQSGSSALCEDGTAAQMVGQLDKTLNHSVLVQQLEPSTKYYFKTLSQNEIKITGASEIVEMTTPERIPLTITDLSFTNTTNTKTDVIWTTNKLSTTKLEYGTSTSYGSVKEDTNQNTDHVMTLENLTSGTSYYVRVNATDVDGNTTISDNYKVLIPAIPTVDNIKIDQVLSTQATITWDSNVNSDSNVIFGSDAIPAISSTSPQPSPQSGEGAAASRSLPSPSQGEGQGEGSSAVGLSQQGKSDSTTEHSVTIIGLESAKTYHYRVKSTDQFNNSAISEDLTFTTPADTTPPTIKNAKSEITTTGTGDTMKIMAIISWETDEPATSQVAYGQGLSSEYPNKTDEITSFNMTHTVIIPDLRPNASYQYQIIAKDASGNLTKGDDLTLITPPKDKSLLQMVLKSLEETFSWVKRLPESPIIRRFHR